MEETELLFATDFDSGGIPTEIQLFANGVTDTSKGTFIFDEESADAVMAAFALSGVDRLPFDAGHSMLNPAAPPEGHRALGWFVPGVSESGLMALDVQWTDAGREALENREFRFFSPAITFDPETRRIASLINVALTNIPATRNQKPLVLDGASGLEPQQPQQGKQNMEALLTALGVKDEISAVSKVKDLEVALSGAQEQLSAKDDQLIEAQAQLAAFAVQREEEQKAAKLSALSDKLPPAQREFAASLSIEQLDKFAATLGDSVVTAAPVSEPGEPGAAIKLSDVQKKVCKSLGLSQADYIKTLESEKESI